MGRFLSCAFGAFCRDKLSLELEIALIKHSSIGTMHYYS